MNLNQITISTNKLSQSVEFYKKLGLELIVDSSRYARFLVIDGQATLSVSLTDQPMAQSLTTIYFECDRLDEKVKELKSKGLEFIDSPTDKSWLWREAHLRDPDGHLICLYFAGENRVNPPWRVQSSST